MTKMVSLHNTRPPAKHCRLEVLSVTCVSILFLSPEPRTLPHSIRRLWADAIDRPWCAIDFTQLRLHAVPTFHISKQMLHLKISANACRSNRVEVLGEGTNTAGTWSLIRDSKGDLTHILKWTSCSATTAFRCHPVLTVQEN
jgi:hypothetical protein